MDAATQLALMMKARRVFETDGTFLSFPATPLPFAPEDLELMTNGDADADTTRRVLRNQFQFSTLVNLVPRGEVWVPGESTFIWDVYERVLQEAEVAWSTRTAEEEKRYADALRFLRSESGDGDSNAVTAYNQYKDLYYIALQTYLAAKGTAETSAAESVREQWQLVDEPEYRRRLAEIGDDWVIKGFRHEVESAREISVSLGARSPSKRWDEWKTQFNRDLDAVTAVSAGGAAAFMPTSFAPANAVSDAAFQAFTLEAPEIAALLDSVPAETRERLGVTGSDAASMTFEFSSATLVRPWFYPEALRSRFWRLPAPEEMVSDGADPPRGTMPAYVTAIVFARRVVLSVPESQPSEDTGEFTGFTFDRAFDRSLIEGYRIRPEIDLRRHIRPLSPLDAVTPVNPQRVAVTRPAIFKATQPGGGVDAGPQRTPNSSNPTVLNATIAAGLNLANVDAAVHEQRPAAPMASRDARSRLTQEAVQAQLQIKPAILRLVRNEFARLPLDIDVGTKPAPSPQPPPPDMSTIYVLAFICKPVGRSPDPDPSLQWG